MTRPFIEYDRRHWEFSREMTDGIDLEKSPPMETVWEQAVGVLIMGAVGAAALVVIYNIGRVFL